MHTPLTQEQLEVHLRAARAERAQVLGAMISGIPAALGRVFARVSQRLERSATMSELNMLDDATLKDIGLYRGEIWHVADAAARGEDFRQPANAATTLPKPILRPLPDTAPPANDNRDRVAALATAGRA